MYHPFNQFIVRSPSLGTLYNELSSIKSYKDILGFWRKYSMLQEAIYIASPDFYSAIKTIEKKEIFSEKEKRGLLALYRYIIRITTRSTPFGLFSSTSIGSTSQLIIPMLEDNIAITIDTGYAYKLIEYLYKKYGKHSWFKYRVNSSIYEWKNEYRYIENSLYHFVFRFKISSIAKDEIITQIISYLLHCKVFTYKDIFDKLNSIGCDEAEIDIFIQELYENKIIYCYYGIHLLGDDVIFIEDFLSNPNIDTKDHFFLQNLLNITNIKNYNTIDFEAIRDHNNFLDIENKSRPIFQMDLFNFKEYKFDIKYSTDLLINAELIPLIFSTSELKQHSKLATFKNDFLSKYENEKIPIQHLFDPSIGLESSYLNLDMGDIFDNFTIDKTLPTNNFKKKILDYYFDRIVENDGNMHDPIQIDKMLEINYTNDHIQPPTISIVYELLNINNNIFYLFKGHDLFSASNLLGRFTLKNDIITSLCYKIDESERENKNFESVVFAEINYIPSLDGGNIVKRRNFRKYSISIIDENPQEKYTIPLSDIYVYINNDNVCLFSDKLQKRIIPVISSAFNTMINKTSIFSFLSDLSMNYFNEPISFDFLYSNGITHIPRIMFKNVILHPKKWILKENFKRKKDSLSDEDILQTIRIWKEKNKVDNSVCYVENDNIIEIDFLNDISVLSFYNIVKNKTVIILEECFNKYKTVLRDSENNPLASEIIMLYHKQ